MPSLLEIFCASFIHDSEKYKLMMSHFLCAFPFLLVLKKFLNIVMKYDKKMKSLFASIIRDHTNGNNNTKKVRNFVVKQ
jgi:hypothetical protein